MLPPHEVFAYHCFQIGTLALIAGGGGGAAHLAGLAGQSFSPVVVRYAFPRYGTHAPFFVSMAADDRGRVYRGLDAFDWIAGRGLLFPRSDAMGVHADRSEDQLFLKELDLAVLPLAFAASSPSAANFPGLRLAAAVEIVADSEYAIAPGGDFPARLSALIPTFQLHVDMIGLTAFDLIPRVLTDPRSIHFDRLDDFLAAPE